MDILEELNKVFCQVFKDPSIKVNDNTTAPDINNWDSLTHVYLIVAVEKRFNIKFETEELLTFQNVGDLRRSIESKL